MRIDRVDVYECRLGGGWCPVIVRVSTDEGLGGVGEVGLAYGVGARASATMIGELVERCGLIGADPHAVEALWDRMFSGTFWGRGGGPIFYAALSAIDIALWDIKGKACGLPVYALLGGPCHERLRVYANGWYHGHADPREFAEGVARVRELGFTATKFDPFEADPAGEEVAPGGALDRSREDVAVARVRAAREAGGEAFDVCVEAHGKFRPTDAIRVGRRLAEHRPMFYEEPMHAMNPEAMAKIAREVPVPVAAGERLYTRYGFRAYLEAQCVDVIQPDVGIAGGITEVRKIASAAETYGIAVQPHNCAGPVLTAAAVHLDFSIPNFLIQETFPDRADDTVGLVTDPFERRIRDGFIERPAGPGLGVELDEAYLAKFPVTTIDA
jgi:galactonate dehydratase